MSPMSTSRLTDWCTRCGERTPGTPNPWKVSNLLPKHRKVVRRATCLGCKTSRVEIPAGPIYQLPDPPTAKGQQFIDQAVAQARQADVAVVVPGDQYNGVWSGNWICLILRWFPTIAQGTRDNKLTRCRESWIHSASCWWQLPGG